MRRGICIAVLLLVAVVALCQESVWTDDFNSALEPGWFWIRESPGEWSLTAKPGSLRMNTLPGGLLGNNNNSRNILLRETPSGNYEIETFVRFTPVENFQIAGLVLYEDDDNFMMLGRAFCGFCGGNKIYFDFEQWGTAVVNKQLETKSKDIAYLKVTKEAPYYSGYYSENGSTWTLVFKHRSREMVFSGVGIVTTAGSGPYADFEYFRVTELPPTEEEESTSGSGSSKKAGLP